MDAVPVGEEQQPEEKETYSQPDVESSAAAVKTVASTGCTDSQKDATDVPNASGGKDEEHESAVSRGSETAAAVKPTQSTDEEADQLDEPVIELDSSPEKMPALSKTKEESLKSPELEVFSIDDEEEQHEEEEHEEEEAVDEEDEYEDMDEDYEVYVEEKESANPHNSMDDDGSKLDLSTDEYTDEDVEAEQSPEKMGAKSASTPRRKSPSDPEQDDDEEEEDEDDDDDDDDEEDDEQEQEDDEDDDDVQIISYDEVIEEDGEDSEENEDNDEDSVRDESEEEHGKRKVHSGAKAKSGSGGHRRGFARFPITHVKYRSLKQKQVASIRKRTIRILNRHSMHVMDHNDDAQALSSDCKVIKTPRTTDPNSVFAPAKSPGQATILRQEIYGSASITSSDSQNDETKETGITTAGGDKQHPEVPPKLTEGAAEKSSNTISSTTASSNPDDKMPTATAVEVSERIADSSDDAVSVLSSSTSTKKSVTAITPTVNSSASTETVEQKTSATEQTSTTDASSKVGDADREVSSAKESSTATSLQDELSKQESNSTTSQKGEGNVPSEKKQTNPSPAGLAEPTADDVMAGIDDFMDHNGSEDDAEDKQQEFNDDLTFQMDVDPPVDDRTKKEERAIDLTAVSEQSASKPQKPKESASSETPLADSEKEPRASSTSVAVSSAKEGNLDLHDKTVVTSTPVTNQKKGQQKRSDREQEAAPSSPSLVKQEHEEEPDVNEAQNLSKQKSSGPRDTQKEVQPEKAPQQPTVSRKRRRSVTTEEDRQSSSGRADQDAEESIEPAKKLKLEVEANYQLHDCVVSEYIETTQNTSVSEIQSHTDALVKEIQELNDMIRETETKWNNLLHLKKVKEEILLRLNRRKHVIGIMDTQLGEVSVYSHLDSSNLSSQHHHQQSGRSSSVGPRPPTPPPEVEIRPASVTNSMHYGFNASNSGGAGTTTASNGGDKASSSHFGNSLISNRRSSSNSVQPASANSSSKASRNKDTNSFVSQFNSSNNAVTMVPLPNTTSMILNARASMNTVEVAKEKSAAVQIQRQILSKPILSNHQQILNNLAMSAGLTGQSGTSSSTNSGSNNGSSNSALLNGHHGSGTLTANQQHQLQIGRQGMRKDVSSIIADYRQKHPENVPRRGRRLKNVGGAGGGGGSSSNSANNNGTSGGNGIGTFGEGGAISLTALSSGGKSPANVRPNSTDSVANRISELLAAAETSRPSSNDSSQSSSNLLTSLLSASGAMAQSNQQFLKDMLAQFAKMSQNEQSLLANLQLLSSNASTTSATNNNTVSSPQQSPQQQHHQNQHHTVGSLHQQQQHQQQQSSLLSKASLPEVTLHPVMNSTAHSDALGGGGSHGNGSFSGGNMSGANSSTNSLLHGILTKSASRPGGQAAAAAAAAAAAVGNFNSFSPTLARLLTVPERMNTQSSSTVTSGALANLQTNSIAGGLNLSKNINEISITPVVGSNYQQTFLAQQQQQQTLQRLREQQLYNLDDEADDSADRLVIDEGDDMGGQRDSNVLHGGKRRGAEINENEVPQCQGCKKQEAKFVCAGCGNQWYCSRACQVNAWDDHSEVCSG